MTAASQIETSLNNLDGLSDLLKKLASSKTGPSNYRSHLQRILSKLSQHATERTPNDALRRALHEWQMAVSESRFDHLTRKTIRILCGLPQAVTDPKFLTFLANRSDMFTSRMMSGLLASYHSTWKQHPHHKDVEILLLMRLRSFSGKSKLVTHWKQNVDWIIGDNAPRKLAKRIADRPTQLSDIAQEYNLPTTNTPFLAAVLWEGAQLCCASFVEKRWLDLQSWNYIRDSLLEHPLIRKEQRQLLLAALLKGVHKHLPDTQWKPAQEGLKDFILSHKEFGDPRTEYTRWANFDPAAKQIFLSWLSEEELELFFELIILNDPHRRKSFWLQYLRKIKGSRVIVGRRDRERHAIALMKLSTKGRNYASGDGLDTSAFILDFGEIVAVEFSEVGNACYIYESSTFRAMYPTIYNRSFDLPNLKRSHHATHWQRHDPYFKWKAKLATVLAEWGVYPD